MLKRVVLWDLDGTIQDSEALAKGGTRRGFLNVLCREPTVEEYAGLIGRPVSVVYRELFDEDVASKILDVGTMYYQEHSDKIHCYSGIPEALSELHDRGHRLGIVSSKRRFHIERELELKGLNSLFEVIVAQEDTVLHKPNPAPLLLAAERLFVSPKDCIYIGDQPTDMQAAKQAGMESVGAIWGDGTIERLAPMSPALIATKPADVLDYLSEESDW